MIGAPATGRFHSKPLKKQGLYHSGVVLLFATNTVWQGLCGNLSILKIKGEVPRWMKLHSKRNWLN